jgi:hypothetical protein
MLSWTSYIEASLQAALWYIHILAGKLAAAQGSLEQVKKEREEELAHLLVESICPRIPFWPRGIRGGGQVKQASTCIPLSPWQWKVLVSNSPVRVLRVTERATLAQPHNTLQASLFALRRERRGGGYSTIEALSFVYNHKRERLTIVIRADSFNKFGVRIRARAPSAKAFGAARSIAQSSVVPLL